MNLHPIMAEALAPFVPPRRIRTLAHVLADVAIARKAEQAAWERTRADYNSDKATKALNIALDELEALCDEARQMIEDATGVSWDAIAAASL